MEKKHMVVVLGISLLCFNGCEEETSSPQSVPLAVESDAVTQAAIEELIRADPNVYIPYDSLVIPESRTAYSMKIVKPDPGMNYSILRVEPDPNVKYTMLIIDPSTQNPPAQIGPDALEAIKEELKQRMELAPNE